MIIIMAQGQGSRWGSGHFKHKISVPHPAYGDRHIGITGRQIFQCNKAWLVPLVVGWSELLVTLEGDFDFLCLNDPGETLFEGIRQTYRYWDDVTTILLGDVIFSEDVFNDVLMRPNGIRLIGRSGQNLVTGKKASEIFALSFSSDKNQDISGFSGGRLWDLEASSLRHDFVNIQDWTDDLDSPEEYDQFYEKLVEAARL